MDIRVAPGVDVRTIQRIHTTAVQAAAASDFRLALHLFRQCIAMQENPIMHMGAGECAANLKRHADAEFHYRAALRLHPNFADAHFNLGNLFEDMGEHAKSQSEFEIAIALKPTGEAFNNLGNILRYQLKLEEAEVAYENAVSLGFHGAEMNLALLKLLRNDYQEGWRLFESRTVHGDESAYGGARAMIKSLEKL